MCTLNQQQGGMFRNDHGTEECLYVLCLIQARTAQVLRIRPVPACVVEREREKKPVVYDDCPPNSDAVSLTITRWQHLTDFCQYALSNTNLSYPTFSRLHRSPKRRQWCRHIIRQSWCIEQPCLPSVTSTMVK